MNVIDRAIASFNPEKALKREVARKKLEIINTGYSNYGASRSKKSLLGWISRGGSPKEDISDNIKTLRQRSRDLFMGAPIATSALKTTRTNVIGGGLRLKSQIDGEFLGLTPEETRNLETQIEREFSLWAESKNCDVERVNDFYELQQVAFLSWIMNGDAFVMLPTIKRINEIYDIRILLIEADRVCNKNYVSNSETLQEGVETNENGEITYYHICSRHPLATTWDKAPEWIKVKAYGSKTGRPNILHLMESERIGQRRGVPILAPVIEALKQLSRYTEAELMAAVVSGMFTVFIESKNTDDGNAFGSNINFEDEIDSDDDTTYELGNGAVVQLGEGETAKEINPGRPNTAFDGFVNAITRQIGAALEIPKELLTKEFTASYSASRAALLEAWKMFRMRRTWMANDFCQPIFVEWMHEAVAKERIYAPGFFNNPLIRKAYCNAEWSGPSAGQLDPNKEVDAAIKRIDNGFSTAAKETMELTGGDYYQNIKQRKQEVTLIEEVRNIVREAEQSKITNS
ncbi:phage portal protein [Clostridium butyricum]